MGYEIPGFVLGVLNANEDLSEKQYLAMNVVPADGAGVQGEAAVEPAGSGNPAAGILQNNPGIGEAAAVMVGGVSKAVLGDTVTVGQELMVGVTGLVPATSGKSIIAQALEAGDEGDICAVLLLRNGLKA